MKKEFFDKLINASIIKLGKRYVAVATKCQDKLHDKVLFSNCRRGFALLSAATELIEGNGYETRLKVLFLYVFDFFFGHDRAQNTLVAYY